MALLEAVADGSVEGEPVAVLAARCALNRATAWRLLGTLEARGLVDRDPATQRYTVGFAVSRLAASAGVDGLDPNLFWNINTPEDYQVFLSAP